MVSKKIFLVVFVALIFAVSFYFGKNTPVKEVVGNYDVVRNFKYSLNLKNISSRDISNVKVWLSAPVAIGANQKSVSITSEQNHVVFQDHSNNQEMYFSYDDVVKNEIKHIVINIEMAFSKVANENSDVDLDRYLLAEKYIDSTNSEISERAITFKGANHIETNAKILPWLKGHHGAMVLVLPDVEAIEADKLNVIDVSAEVDGEIITNDLPENMKASENLETSALDVLHNQHNSKSGMLYLYLAITRSLGIPSRGVVGFDFSTSNILTAGKATIWAEYFDGSYWRLVDLDKFEQVDDASKFIAFKVLDDMPGRAGWEPFSVLHKEAAFIVDTASVKLTVH